MNPLKKVIQDLLALDSPSNYETWEDAEEGILDDLDEAQQIEYEACGGCDGLIQEWFEAGD